jgi:hypothetical protein
MMSYQMLFSTILNQSSLVYDHEMKERRNLREKDLVHSIPGDKVKDVKIWR